MLMASQFGEVQALRLHATELLMLLGTAVILVLEGPVQVQADQGVPAKTLVERI
jgi:hypothetical protein